MRCCNAVATGRAPSWFHGTPDMYCNYLPFNKRNC
jgi:hypothetical protein